MRYIRDTAPIIIHFRSTLLEKFLNDTHYRSMFEISPGSTGARKAWEKKLFNSCYDRSKPYERVKYGSLNIGMFLFIVKFSIFFFKS